MIPDPSGRARGRRDNGLTASSFSSVGDVDPRLGEHLLDLLGLDGIAAYLQPTADHDALTRAVSLPSRPTDRLYVDRHRAADARAVVAAAQSGPDDDAIWAELVASLELPAADPKAAATEAVDATAETATQAELEGAAKSEAEPSAWLAPTEPEAAEAEEEGYVPPPPPPLPRISRQTLGGLLAITLGIFLLAFGSGLLGLDSVLAFRFGIAAIVAGVGYLIWRMRDDRVDDGPDDGAVV